MNSVTLAITTVLTWVQLWGAYCHTVSFIVRLDALVKTRWPFTREWFNFAYLMFVSLLMPVADLCFHVSTSESSCNRVTLFRIAVLGVELMRKWVVNHPLFFYIWGCCNWWVVILSILWYSSFSKPAEDEGKVRLMHNMYSFCYSITQQSFHR